MAVSWFFQLFEQNLWYKQILNSQYFQRFQQTLGYKRASIDWPADLVDHISHPKPFHPVVKELEDLIETNSKLCMLFNQMFEQIPARAPYDQDPTGKPQARDLHTLLILLNVTLTRAPEYNGLGGVGLPISSIINWAMSTKSGSAAFLDPGINAQIGKLLSQWTLYLGSEASTYVLNDSPTGWFCAAAKKQLLDGPPETAGLDFDQVFECNASLPRYGFQSWDDFFTRRFRDGIRPVAAPDDSSVITHTCESAPYHIATNVQESDSFWIKSYHYSLRHMLADDLLTTQFVNGTLYQAFLSPESYHRWHSPVSGTVVKATLQPGTYFSKSQTEGFDPSDITESQAYVTGMAARAIILIEADNADVGLMCVMSVGWAEVSTCEITVSNGQRVNKGDLLGMFHFGGSTHCMLFRRGVKVVFDLRGQTPGASARNVPVNSKIASVETRSNGTG
ncbi:hypothetical protein MMC17_002574 [Xylographa soralifera]|nr:hypothetical protein [Xylographa soralifera]